MKDILEALSSASPNIERKLYTILTGRNAGKKYLRKTGSSADRQERRICSLHIEKNWEQHRIRDALKLWE